MSDQFLLFLLLVLPVLIAGILAYLGILAVGLGTVVAAFRSAHPVLKGTLLLVGVLVILSPVLFHTGIEMRAQHKADQRQAKLEQLERTSLAGRLPGHFIALGGSFRPELLTSIKTRYGLRTYPEAENRRLAEAYRSYRRAELCHRRHGGEKMPGTALPKCRTLPETVQGALDLREPLLVFAEGFNTSMREDNVLAGDIYEIRLITPQEDLLVAYFEERTVEGTPTIFNPWTPPRRNSADTQPPTLEQFIETALQGASR